MLLPAVLASVLLVSGMAWTEARALSLVTHELPPYSFPIEGRAPGGVAVEIVQCAAEALSIPLEIGFYPWKRAQFMVEHGLADGFFAASQSARRDAYAVLSAPIAPQEWRWYLKKDSPLDPRSPAFKAQAVTASFLGANMQDWLVENAYKVINSPPSNTNLLDMLLNGRMDAILANRLVMEHLLAQTGNAVMVKSYVALDKPLGIYFSKTFLARQSPQYLKRWNLAIGACASQKAVQRQ